MSEGPVCSVPLWIDRVSDPAHADRPLIVLLHGALATSDALSDFASVCARAYDVALIDLPGHGRSPALPRASMDALVGCVSEAIRPLAAQRRTIIVGESLGGTIAIAMSAAAFSGLIGVIAADPILSTKKLWPIAPDLRRALLMTAYRDEELKAVASQIPVIRVPFSSRTLLNSLHRLSPQT